MRRGALFLVVWICGTSCVTAQTPRAAPASVTFTHDIAPLVYRHCVTCHHPGGPGPFSLLTYDGARQHARQMAAVTASRYMPPWKVEPGYGEFIGAHRLTTAEIDTFQQWAASGAPEGRAADLPPTPPATRDWQLGTPDLVVTMPAFSVPVSGDDVFRIFVVPVPTTLTRYVRGLEFRPGSSNVVHHANIRVDRTPASRELDAEDPLPGYDGLLARSAIYPDGHFLAWTPGQAAPLLPKGLAWRLDPGTDLVIELHFQPTGRAEHVQPTIGLYFGSDPPERVPGMLRLGRQTIDIAPGDAHYIVTDSFVLPVDVQVLALQPHAHYRARVARAAAALPDGTTRPLIFIPDWDFRWQQVYRYVTPLALPAGTRLSMEYVYDNSVSNPRSVQPLRHVTWGQRSGDEMGDLWIQVLTRTDAELNRLLAVFKPKVMAEDVLGYEARLRVEPDSVALHDDVALLYLEQGRPGDAVTHFQRSAALRPASPAVHFNLGTALSAAGRDVDATASYREALRLRPDYVLAHNNLGGVLLRRGALVEAQTHLDAAVQLAPDNIDAHQNLGVLLHARGNDAAACEHFLVAASLAAAANDLNRAVANAEQAFALAPSTRRAEAARRVADYRARAVAR